MATTLTSKIAVEVDATQTVGLDLGVATNAINYGKKVTLASGTTANKADLIFHDQRTLAASTSESLDLAGGLTDAFGNTITFVKIKAIVIAAAAGNTNTVNVGGAASNAFVNWVADATDIIKVRPGGAFVLYAPDLTAYGVTASTGDLLKVANGGSDSSVTYDIVLIGTSA